MQVEYDLRNSGLEDFVEAIKELQKLIPEASIDLQIGELTGNKGISFVTENVRRKYASVLIRIPKSKDVLILEIGRPVRRSIATLFLISVERHSIDSILRRDVILSVLEILFQNNGSWNRDIFRKDKHWEYSFLKHLEKDTTWRWANKITQKLT